MSSSALLILIGFSVGCWLSALIVYFMSPS